MKERECEKCSQFSCEEQVGITQTWKLQFFKHTFGLASMTREKIKDCYILKGIEENEEKEIINPHS